METENNNTNKNFLKGTLILTLSSIVVKVIGSLNWIFLSRVLGGEGIGLYQMGFPIYLMAITVSSAGIPVAISIITSEKLANKDYRGAKRVFNVSLRLLFISGLIFSSALLFGAGWLTENHFIRDARAYYSIIALAPAVFFVTFLASFRKYFSALFLLQSVSQGHECAIRDIKALKLNYTRAEESRIFAMLEDAPERTEELTDREREIAELVARGLRNSEIARTLHVSENTVKSHLKSIFKKLNIDRRSGLVELLR